MYLLNSTNLHLSEIFYKLQKDIIAWGMTSWRSRSSCLHSCGIVIRVVAIKKHQTNSQTCCQKYKLMLDILKNNLVIVIVPVLKSK
jgi:hypothetical protein